VSEKVFTHMEDRLWRFPRLGARSDIVLRSLLLSVSRSPPRWPFLLPFQTPSKAEWLPRSHPQASPPAPSTTETPVADQLRMRHETRESLPASSTDCSTSFLGPRVSWRPRSKPGPRKWLVRQDERRGFHRGGNGESLSQAGAVGIGADRLGSGTRLSIGSTTGEAVRRG
jgi:hypothetical protein